MMIHQIGILPPLKNQSFGVLSASNLEIGWQCRNGEEAKSKGITNVRGERECER